MKLGVSTVLLAIFVSYSNAAECLKSGPCFCETKEGIIDLTSLASNDQPRFSGLEVEPFNASHPLEQKNTLFYNPCLPFTLNTTVDCRGVAGCRSVEGTFDGKNITSYRSFGTQESYSFTAPNTLNEAAIIKYSAKNNTDFYNLTVEFHCNEAAVEPTSEPPIYQDNTNKTILFKVKTLCACWNGCKQTTPQSTVGSTARSTVGSTARSTEVSTADPPEEHTGLSAGTVLIIIFIVLIFLYIFGGILYNKIVAGAQGLEIFPHHEFWMALPGLIFDGARFVCNCCQSRNKSATYDAM